MTTTASPTTLRELDARTNDADEATFAFHHPFAFAETAKRSVGVHAVQWC